MGILACVTGGSGCAREAREEIFASGKAASEMEFN